jgi:succinate dehydrogenase/fumarate reductase flavoprotein subunit
VWYESPATRLIQDPNTKIIHGIELLQEGKIYRVRAKNGVVLAAGGFENNPFMLENFVQLADGYSKAARYNTGDGIKMAQEAGADLWHMSTMAGPDVNFINPDTGIAQAYAVGFMTPWTSQNSLIYVGANGRRFMNEAAMTRHGHVEVAGTWFSLLVPQNAWAIFDESARLAGPAYPSWSRGMEEEIAKGWVIRAGTIQELAQKTGVNAEGLQDEIARFNAYCRTGNDPQYGNGVLKPLAAQGPYYAFPLKATLTNTQGGPRRNINCEIVTPYDTVIPHLYSAGEMGSFYTDIYNGGGNISECLYTGRTAGANAARPKDDVSPVNVLSSNKIDFRSDSLEEFLAKAQSSLGPNEYLGLGSGMGRELVLKVKVSGTDIQDINFIRLFETPGVCDRAVAQIPRAIIDTDSADVDSVTGATVTSQAIIAAVKDALSKVN